MRMEANSVNSGATTTPADGSVASATALALSAIATAPLEFEDVSTASVPSVSTREWQRDFVHSQLSDTMRSFVLLLHSDAPGMRSRPGVSVHAMPRSRSFCQNWMVPDTLLYATLMRSPVDHFPRVA